MLAFVGVGIASAGASTASGQEDATAKNVVVVLKNNAGRANPIAAEHSRRLGIAVAAVYEHAIRGYSARVSPHALGALARDPRVDFVETDGPVSASATQLAPTWGLDRLDQRTMPLSGTFTYQSTGAGVTAYVVDTGIRLSHEDFGGRAVSGYDAIDGGSADDCNGHGTHVAGTIGGAAYGVAKQVTLVAVRVLDCAGSGTVSGAIAGLNWIAATHPAGRAAVVNMSLGAGANRALDAAVNAVIDQGVPVAVAAGNHGGDACRYSPARVAAAMTTAATDPADVKPVWSNDGRCVDWFAPGVGVTSAAIASDSATATMTGTSMAAPHTAGVAALYLQSAPLASPAAVRSALYTATTRNTVSGSAQRSPALLFSSL